MYKRQWEHRADGKVKYAIRPRGKELLYLGGLYTKPEPGALPRFPILTLSLIHILFTDEVSKFCGRVTVQNVSESADASVSARKLKKPFSCILRISLSICYSGEPI